MTPSQPPPSRFTGQPRHLVLPRGATLVRVHDAEFAAGAFRPIPILAGRAARLRGGRFDATESDPFPSLYAASDGPTAISEALLRDLPMDDSGVRILPRTLLAGRQISWLTTEAELSLVTLRSGQDLAAIGQDAWLTTSPRSEYPLAREWCSAIRRWAPWAHGLTWRSLREPDGFAYIFFGDRPSLRQNEGCFSLVTANVPVAPPNNRLDRGAGLIYMQEILDAYRAVVA